MSLDVSQIATYSDSQIYNACRMGIINISLGAQEYEVLGKKCTRADLKSLVDTMNIFEARVVAAGNRTGGNISLTTFLTEQSDGMGVHDDNIPSY